MLATSAASIPYRSGTAVSAGNLIMAGFVTLLALAILVGVLVYLRRRGWSGSWFAGKRAERVRGIELRASRRVGMSSFAHVIAYQGMEYLVVESGRGSTATVLRIDPPRDGTEEAP